MKILIITPQRLNGVYFHRQIYPHTTMVDIYDDVKIVISDSTLKFSDEEFSTFDIMHVSYSYNETYAIDRALRMGVKLAVDVDDYWILGDLHELKATYKKLDWTNKFKTIMGKADFVTTTTELLAEKIRDFGKDVVVLPNGLHTTEDYGKPVENKELVLGWVGGNTHTIDLSMIQHIKNGLKHPVFIPDMYKQVFGNLFNYYQNQGIPYYLDLYNKFDIILAPLVSNNFNKFKSPLKLVEAGFYGKPLLISNVEPFLPHLKHGENCLIVRKHSDWAKGLKKLRSPELREYLGQNLRKYVEQNFDIEKITSKRYEFYKKCLTSP